MRAFLALGSNIEPRHKYLRRALHLLEADSQVRVLQMSRIFASQSVEGGGPGDFLNAALEIETTLPARELLALCQSIEDACGRGLPNPGEHRSGERTLDLDILSFGDECSCDPVLMLPHPRALGRPFVLLPLLDLLGQSGWVLATELSWDQDEEE